jgi:elongation factor Tu
VPVQEITCFSRPVRSAGPGAALRVVLSAQPHGSLAAGQVLATPGSLQTTRWFLARLTLLPALEGGRNRAVQNGYSPSFLLQTARFRGRIHLPIGVRHFHPGETHSVGVDLPWPVFVAAGQTFSCRDSPGTVGYGMIERLS